MHVLCVLHCCFNSDACTESVFIGGSNVSLFLGHSLCPSPVAVPSLSLRAGSVCVLSLQCADKHGIPTHGGRVSCLVDGPAAVTPCVFPLPPPPAPPPAPSHLVEMLRTYRSVKGETTSDADADAGSAPVRSPAGRCVKYVYPSAMCNPSVQDYTQSHCIVCMVSVVCDLSYSTLKDAVSISFRVIRTPPHDWYGVSPEHCP